MSAHVLLPFVVLFYYSRGAELTVHSKVRVIKAGSWFAEEAARAVPGVLGFPGVFCANDRLAAAVVEAVKAGEINGLRIVGFDDAPVAELFFLLTK